MAATLTITQEAHPGGVGPFWVLPISGAWSGTYETGGESLPVPHARVILAVVLTPTAGMYPVWTPSTGKVRLFADDEGPATEHIEIAADTDVSDVGFSGLIYYI